MKISLRRGSQSALDSATLDLGEVGYTTDTKRLYVGDGVGKQLLSSEFTLEENGDLSYSNGRISISLAPTAGDHLINKTYADNLPINRIIYQGNSKVEVSDTGTGTINVSADGTRVADFTTNGIQLEYGTRIDEFSIDGNLGNSDAVVPTEKAVKTYVDNIDKIQKGDTGIELFDLGTGTIVVSADGNIVSDFTSNGLKLENGVRINDFSNDTTLSGNSSASIPTEYAVKQYIDNKERKGRESLSTTDTSKAITFTDFSDTNYTISVILTNTTDSPPSIYSYMVTSKATGGFTVTFSGAIDSNNYILEWMASHD